MNSKHYLLVLQMFFNQKVMELIRTKIEARKGHVSRRAGSSTQSVLDLACSSCRRDVL